VSEDRDRDGRVNAEVARAKVAAGFASDPELERILARYPPRVTLEAVHAAFLEWFGPDYDLQALDAVLACAASHRLPGVPAWMLLIAGPGGTKTETVVTLE
jgi:hypothetical protein